ncbi:hypothetical protein GCM10022222_05180 [Amycolatopsis ultiminotia]|uniref:Uncharacterized protein n=1 Tax=Amycolatopsis ultiminotia TaxID=543629 RepID=A0ABP6V004_9PSEU
MSWARRQIGTREIRGHLLGVVHERAEEAEGDEQQQQHRTADGEPVLQENPRGSAETGTAGGKRGSCHADQYFTLGSSTA